MVRGAAVLALASVLGATGCLRARGTPQEPVVVGFRIEGLHAISEDALKEKLATQGPSGLVRKEAPRFDPDALAVDRRRIEAYYRERGYYKAHVEDPQLVEKGPGRVFVTLRVVEGRPTRVSKVTVNGFDAAPEAQRKMGALPLKPGDVFTDAAYDGARGAIFSALRSNGWANAQVAQRATVDPETATAEVTYDVDTGRRWRFGPIRVSGISAVLHGRIREQALGAVRPGEWFDERRLADAQARVFALGVFGAVRVERSRQDPERGTIDVVVSVRQAPFRTERFGPGLGFQVIRWDAQALASWQHRNFRGELRRLGTEARLGYAWLPSPLRTTKQGTVGLLALEFGQPGAFTRYVDISTRLEAEKGIEQAYDFYSERLRLGLPLRLASRWTLVPSYNLEVYELSNYGVQFDPQAPQGTRTLENCRGSVCFLTYLEQRIAWDGRDHPVNTRRGLYVAFALQEGFDVGTYGYQYLRFLPELRFFLPLGTSAVLATRARVGALVPVHEQGDPPVIARFFAGGPLSMRGYYTRRLSKMVRQGNDWVPVGGNGLADGTVELRFDVTGNFGGAIFLDAGNVSDASAVPSTWQAALDPTLLQFAGGVGLRYRTPFGPLRLDVAARLPDRVGSLSSTSFPAVPYTTWPDGTPHREPILAVHLSIGEAF